MRHLMLVAIFLAIGCLVPGCAASSSVAATTAATTPRTTLEFAPPLALSDYKREVSTMNAKFLSLMTQIEQAQARSDQSHTIDEQLTWTKNLKSAYGEAVEGVKALLIKAVTTRPATRTESFHARLLTYYQSWESLLRDTMATLDYDVAQSTVQHDFDLAEQPAWQAIVAANEKEPPDYVELKKTWAGYFEVWSTYTGRLGSITAPGSLLAPHVQLANVAARVALNRQPLLDSVEALEQARAPAKDAIASYQANISRLKNDMEAFSKARVTWSEAYTALGTHFEARKQALYQQQAELNRQFGGL